MEHWWKDADRQGQTEVHQESHTNWTGIETGLLQWQVPPSSFNPIILKISVRTSQRINLFLLSQANRLKLVKNIHAFHPNGAQTVRNDLTSVTVKAAGGCNYHCTTKSHSAHEKYFGHSGRIFEQDKRQRH